MQQQVLIFFLFIFFTACNGQTKKSIDYSNHILGCWKAVEMYYEVKSNYSQIDSMILENRKGSAEKRIHKDHIISILKGIINEYHEGKPDNNPSNYYLKGDSLFMQGTLRPDRSKGKMNIVNDTLFFELIASTEFQNLVSRLEWDHKIIPPKDLKLEKMVRHVTFIRVHDCDK